MQDQLEAVKEAMKRAELSHLVAVYILLRHEDNTTQKYRQMREYIIDNGVHKNTFATYASICRFLLYYMDPEVSETHFIVTLS